MSTSERIGDEAAAAAPGAVGARRSEHREGTADPPRTMEERNDESVLRTTHAEQPNGHILPRRTGPAPVLPAPAAALARERLDLAPRRAGGPREPLCAAVGLGGTRRRACGARPGRGGLRFPGERFFTRLAGTAGAVASRYLRTSSPCCPSSGGVARDLFRPAPRADAHRRARAGGERVGTVRRRPPVGDHDHRLHRHWRYGDRQCRVHNGSGLVRRRPGRRPHLQVRPARRLVGRRHVDRPVPDGALQQRGHPFHGHQHARRRHRARQPAGPHCHLHREAHRLGGGQRRSGVRRRHLLAERYGPNLGSFARHGRDAPGRGGAGERPHPHGPHRRDRPDRLLPLHDSPG